MKLAEEFRKTAGDVRVLDKPAQREMYSHDIGDVPTIMTGTFFRTQPDFVVQPQNADEIKKVLQFANDHKIPVVPRGAASWGFGGVIPTKAGIVIDLSPFRNILALDVAQKTVTVEAGARWSDIDIAAKKQGLCLRTYPSSKFSTVGGWVSTGGCGINSFKYGHLSKQIVAMTVVTGAGEIKQLKPTDREFAYFVSGEGEFGIIVEVTLKLREVPRASYPHLLYFPGDPEAFAFIERVVQGKARQELNPNVIRFLDENHLSDTNELMRTALFKKSAGVLVEFDNAEDDDGLSDDADWQETILSSPAKRVNGLLVSRNLIKVVVCLQILAKAALLALVAAGQISGHIDLGQSLALTVIVADTIVAVMGIALGVQIRRRTGTLDVRKLASLRG